MQQEKAYRCLNIVLQTQIPLAGNNYYRLRMVDNDKTYAYSKIQSVEFGDKGDFLTMYPNPVSEILNIKDVDLQKIMEVSIHDISGKRVYQTGALKSGGINVSSFANGFYLVTVRLNDGNAKTEKILVNH